MIDLNTLDGEPRAVAAASLDNMEEALKGYVASMQEAEKYVRNAAMDEVLSADPECDPATAVEPSAEIRTFHAAKREAINALQRIKLIRSKVDLYEGYAD